MSKDASEQGRKLLSQILADEFSLYVKLRNAHWGVQSIQFKELHEMFEQQYEFVDGVFDEIAERLRTLGGAAYIQPSHLEQDSHLTPASTRMHSMHAKEIVQAIAVDTEGVVVSLREALNQLEKQGEDHGTMDLLASTLRKHEKHVWMLRAHLGQ